MAQLDAEDTRTVSYKTLRSREIMASCCTSSSPLPLKGGLSVPFCGTVHLEQIKWNMQTEHA